MANWRQAADAIVQVLANTPAGTSAVDAAVQAIEPSSNVKTYVGWPDPSQLVADLRQTGLVQTAHVSVYAVPGSSLSSRYTKEPTTVKINPTELAVLGGTTIQLSAGFSGTNLTDGDNIFIYINGIPIATTVHGPLSDSLAAVAARLVSAINGAGLPGVSAAQTGSLTGVIVTGAHSLAAEAFGQGTRTVEVSRITRRFQVSAWAADNLVREALALAIVPALADIEFLSYADGSKGRILLQAEVVDDMQQPAQIMRADTFWEVEYPYFISSTLARVGAVVETIAPFTPQQQVLAATPIGLTNFAGVRVSHNHLREFLAPAAALPTAVWLLSTSPVPGSELIFVNGTKCKPISTPPGLNEYNIADQTVTFWRALDATDDVEAVYEI